MAAHFHFRIETYEVAAMVTPAGLFRMLQFHGIDEDSLISGATLVFSDNPVDSRIEPGGRSVMVTYPEHWFDTVYHIVQTEAPVWFGGSVDEDPDTGNMRPMGWGVATDTEVVGEGFADSDARV